MKVLILSDLHLTNKFDEKKYNYLKNLINKYEDIIINGDFWSVYSVTFNEFIESEWNKLFSLLKNKNTTYIYGNHDKREWMNEKIELFCNTHGHKHRIETKSKKYLVEHGDKLVKRKHFEHNWYIKFIRSLKIDDIMRQPLEKLVIRFFGIETYNKLPKYQIEDIKEYTKNNLKEDEFLIVGHIHSPEISVENKYSCSGIIDYGHAQYLIVTEEGVHSKHETY